MKNDTHSIPIGYLFWIFGFMGAHRFYYGRPVSGTIYFFTLGLLGVGWIVDLFLIPGMDRSADRTYKAGALNYDLAWGLLIFLGIFGAHRFYQAKWITAILYFFTGAFLGLGILYDFWTLNEQLDSINSTYSRNS